MKPNFVFTFAIAALALTSSTSAEFGAQNRVAVEAKHGGNVLKGIANMLHLRKPKQHHEEPVLEVKETQSLVEYLKKTIFARGISPDDSGSFYRDPPYNEDFAFEVTQGMCIDILRSGDGERLAITSTEVYNFIKEALLRGVALPEDVKLKAKEFLENLKAQLKQSIKEDIGLLQEYKDYIYEPSHFKNKWQHEEIGEIENILSGIRDYELDLADVRVCLQNL